MGTQKYEQIFAAVCETGLLEAVTPLCNQAHRTIVHPVLRAEMFSPRFEWRRLATNHAR